MRQEHLRPWITSLQPGLLVAVHQSLWVTAQLVLPGSGTGDPPPAIECTAPSPVGPDVAAVPAAQAPMAENCAPTHMVDAQQQLLRLSTLLLRLLSCALHLTPWPTALS